MSEYVAHDKMYKLYVRPHLDYGDIIYHKYDPELNLGFTKKFEANDLLTRLLGPYQEIRSLIFFVRPELARAVRKSEGFVFLVRTK